MSSAIKYSKIAVMPKGLKETKTMTQEEIVALLTSQTILCNWGDLVDEDPVDPAQAAAWLAESRAIQAQRAAERAAYAQTPEGHAEAIATHRKTVSEFLLRHIQYNISMSKAVQGRKIKPVWRVLYANQCDHQASAQELLDARTESMWDWIRAQKEYQDMTEEMFEALGMGWESYWEEKYEAHLAETLPGNLHIDATGMVEICRFFNMPGGCRPKPGGGACPYRHVAGAAQEVCRFFNSPRGCKNGEACPFAHTAPTASANVSGGMDFATARAGGPSWRSVDAGSSSRRSSVSTDATEDGWEMAGARRFSPVPTATAGGGRPPLPPQRTSSAPQAECRFFRTPRGCRSGASCPYKH
jgi:hypothetical protein